MRNERWDLICEADPKKLAGLLSYLFSDEYLFVSPRFQKAVTADRKGYVSLECLEKEPMIADFFRTHEVGREARREGVQLVVQKLCSQLRFNSGRVRRVVPFNKRSIRRIKPVCLDKLKVPLTISDIRQYIGGTAFSPLEHFHPHDDHFLYVYAPHYREKLAEGHSMPFAVVEYQKLCEERERESRYWEQQEKRFYAAVSIEDRAQREYRQNYLRQEYRTRTREHQREMVDDIDEEEENGGGQGESTMDQLRAALRPNPQFNHLLALFMQRMEKRIDEE